jgi:hypothetical protein
MINPLPLTNDMMRPMSDKLRQIIKIFTNTNTPSLLPLQDMSQIQQYDKLKHSPVQRYTVCHTHRKRQIHLYSSAKIKINRTELFTVHMHLEDRSRGEGEKRPRLG